MHNTFPPFLSPPPFTGPSAPRNITVRLVTPLLVEIRWSIPALSNGQIIRFTVYGFPIAVFGPAIGKRQAPSDLPAGTIKQVGCCVIMNEWQMIMHDCATIVNDYILLEWWNAWLCVSQEWKGKRMVRTWGGGEGGGGGKGGGGEMEGGGRRGLAPTTSQKRLWSLKCPYFIFLLEVLANSLHRHEAMPTSVLVHMWIQK